MTSAMQTRVREVMGSAEVGAIDTSLETLGYHIHTGGTLTLKVTNSVRPKNSMTGHATDQVLMVVTYLQAEVHLF